MTTQTKQTIPAGIWTLDPIHSSVGFAILHNGLSTFRSGFSSFEVRLSGGEQPRLEGSVEIASLELAEDQLRGHLLSPEFFDAGHYPRLRFRSSAVDVADDGALRVRGELEIKGQTHEVEGSGRFAELAADLGGNERLGLSLKATVDRRSFGLDWNADLPSGAQVLDYEVEIAVELELVATVE
jgi:polyisoprenoid-binding protein YceI